MTYERTRPIYCIEIFEGGLPEGIFYKERYEAEDALKILLDKGFFKEEAALEHIYVKQYYLDIGYPDS